MSETEPTPQETYLYATFYRPGAVGSVYWKRMKTGSLRWQRRKFTITRVEVESGVFEDWNTNKIYSRRYHQYGIPA